MKRVECTGRDGVTREFWYSYEPSELDPLLYVTVETIPRPASNETFDITLEKLDESTYRETMIIHHFEPAYVAMGIPDAMLPLLKKELGKEIESSPVDDGEGAMRSGYAEKMWRRLEEKGFAEYLPEKKVYRVK